MSVNFVNKNQKRLKHIKIRQVGSYLIFWDNYRPSKKITFINFAEHVYKQKELKAIDIRPKDFKNLSKYADIRKLLICD